MSERTLVPIFVFWAFLTIITPTLILLSENSKADFDSNGNITDRARARRMMGGEPGNDEIRFRTEEAHEALRIAVAEEMAPSPAPNSSQPSYSYHDHRNNTDDGGLKLLSPKAPVEPIGIRSAST